MRAIPQLLERWGHDCLTPLDKAREELQKEQELERSQQKSDKSNSKPRLIKELHSEFPSPAMAMYEFYCAQSGKCHGTTPKDQSQDNSGPMQCQHISSCPLGQFDYVVKKSFQTLWYGVTGTLHSKEHIWQVYEPCTATTTLSAAFIQNTNVDHKKFRDAEGYGQRQLCVCGQSCEFESG